MRRNMKHNILLKQLQIICVFYFTYIMNLHINQTKMWAEEKNAEVGERCLHVMVFGDVKTADRGVRRITWYTLTSSPGRTSPRKQDYGHITHCWYPREM